MFDPSGLKSRYSNLVNWTGLWTNYWTETLPRKKPGVGTKSEHEHEQDLQDAQIRENDDALIETGAVDPPVSSETEERGQGISNDLVLLNPEIAPVSSMAEEDLNKEAEKEMNKEKQDGLKKAEKAEKIRLKAIRKEEEAEVKRRKEEQRKRIIPPRHFIVLPTGLGAALGGSDNWEKVKIAGVQDEVAAHTGLFKRDQNLNYDGLVESVGQRIIDWSNTF